MDQQAPSPQKRGFKFFATRAAALTVSIGIVVIVASQAGLHGCSAARPDIEAENPAQDDRAGAGDSREKGEENDEEAGYMGGAKAPAGGWARPRKPMPQPQAPAQQAPAPQAPQPGGQK